MHDWHGKGLLSGATKANKASMVFADKSKLSVSKTSEEHRFTEMFTYILAARRL